jgi:hypothetical protein
MFRKAPNLPAPTAAYLRAITDAAPDNLFIVPVHQLEHGQGKPSMIAVN